MQAFYSDRFVLPLPAGHRFPMEKYRLLRDRLTADMPQVRMQQAPEATDGELALAHDPAYIDAIANGTLEPALQREIGFPWSPAMAARARRSVGGTLAAGRVAMTEGLAANLAGGTHHSYANKGGGFCVFNDFAVTARVLQAEWARKHGSQHPALNVAIIDLDVHQAMARPAFSKETKASSPCLCMVRKLPVSQGRQRSGCRFSRRLWRWRIPGGPGERPAGSGGPL